MRLLVLLLLSLLLGGCGGGSAASGGGGSATSTGGSVPGLNRTGVALDVTVKRTPSKEALSLATADDVQEVLIDFLDPATLVKIRPTTIVLRTAPSVDVIIDVPVGTWILRIQGRTASGEAAGSRYESPITVVEGQTTEVSAELNPITNLAALQVTPGPNALQAQGTTGQFTAIGIFTDLTQQNLTAQVQWTSSNPSVANVSATGLVLAVSNGATVISARSGNVTGSSNLTVTPTAPTSLQVTPPTATLSPGLTQQLTATAVFADNTNQNVTTQTVWTSTSPSVATVTNTGLVTAVGVGNATIRGAFGNLTGTATVTVSPTLTRIELTPANVVVPVGSTQSVRATGVFSDNTTQDLSSSVTWTTASGAVATVSSSGLVTGVAAGNTSLTASSGTVTATVNVSVEPVRLLRLTVSPSSATLPKGATRAFTATGTFSNNSTRDLTTEVTWTSTDTSIVDVSNANGTQGVATGVSAGQAVLEATLDGLSGPASVNVTPATLVSLAVSPANPEVGSGDLVIFKATGLFSDGTSLDLTANVTWTSGNTSVVVISNAAGTEGQAVSTANGTTTITATSGTVTASTSFTTKAPPPPIPTPTPTPPPTATGVLYTLDLGGSDGGGVALFNNPTTIDGGTPPTRFAAVNKPAGMALDATRNLLYVGSDATVLRYNPATGLTAPVTITMPEAVTALAVDSTRDILYVGTAFNVYTFTGASTLAGAPVAKNNIGFGGAPGLAIDSVNDRLWISRGFLRRVDLISTRNGNIDTDAPFVSRIDSVVNPGGLFLDTAGQRLWVSDTSDRVLVFADLSFVGTSSNQAPVQSITGLFSIGGPWVDLTNDVLYLASNTADGAVNIYNGASTLDGPAPLPTRRMDSPTLGNPTMVIVDLTH